MLDELNRMLASIDVDYADIRYEIKKETRIVFTGKELTQIGANTADGYVARVLHSGGFSTIAFTSPKEAEKALLKARENALLLAKNLKEPVKLAPAQVVQDEFTPSLKEDPRQLSIDEKLEITRHYNQIPLNHEGISTTAISYFEVSRDKYFVNTEGSKVREELITNGINGSIISRQNNVLQNVRVGIGGSDGFHSIRNQDEEFIKKTEIALKLLEAAPVKGGVYNVILNPSMAGVFTHEAFGHFSEADLIEDSPSMREKMYLGARLGNEVLTIIDDPTIPNQLGFYRYDDEGVLASRVVLLNQGVLTGRLHSRRTANNFQENPNGHSVAEDYRYAPMIRMGNIYIEPQDKSLNQLLAELGDGLYILDAKGGQTSGENFTFGAQYAYLVKNGKIAEMVRDINIMGNLYQTMLNIVSVGNDLNLSKIGGCGKGQLNIRSSYGGPHILAKNLVIGGV